MGLNIKIFLLCPIPDDQKPINEYLNLQENIFTNWINLPTKKLFKKLFFNFFYFFLLISILTINELNFSTFYFKFLFQNIKFSLLFLFLTLIITLNQWKEISKKFKVSRLFYEEASWFDGQIWDKPFSIIRNDRLLLTQKIKPVINRGEKILLFLIILLIYSLFFL